MGILKINSESQTTKNSNALYQEFLGKIGGAPVGTCPTELASAFIKLCRAQSCGKCVPCRIGLDTLSDILDKILDGKAQLDDIELLEKTAVAISETADCVIGSESAGAILTAIKAFKEDFISHIENDRCVEHFTPVPCVGKCPANVDIPGYIALTKEKRYEDAVRLIRKDNPLPTVCGLVCEHPCENVCRRKMVDDAINIRGIKEFATFKAGYVAPPKIQKQTGKKVAIIGGGPAGLTTAYYLSIMGHNVEIFEKRHKLGGMLRYGIPSYRLPDKYLDQDIKAILDLGVKVHLDTDIGNDVSMEQLKENFDAIYVSIGAHSDKKLGIDGEDKRGVMSAVMLLRAVGDGVAPNFTNKNVVVIGGGNVAMDATRTSMRLGAKSVKCVYRRRVIDMTALPEEVHGAEQEGCEVIELMAPVKINYKDELVTGLTVKPQVIGQFDKGRAKPYNADKDEVVIPCDIIIVAIGQDIESKYFEEKGMATKWNQFQVGNTLTCSQIDGVFAGGDCVSGPATVIRAIEMGKVAAKNIDNYLGFDSNINVEIDIPKPSPAFMPKCGRINMKERPANIRKGDMELMEEIYTEQELHQECSRCLRCDCFGYGSFKGGRKTKW